MKEESTVEFYDWRETRGTDTIDSFLTVLVAVNGRITERRWATRDDLVAVLRRDSREASAVFGETLRSVASVGMAEQRDENRKEQTWLEWLTGQVIDARSSVHVHHSFRLLNEEDPHTDAEREPCRLRAEAARIREEAELRIAEMFERERDRVPLMVETEAHLEDLMGKGAMGSKHREMP
jgi:hypothetical protein